MQKRKKKKKYPADTHTHTHGGFSSGTMQGSPCVGGYTQNGMFSLVNIPHPTPPLPTNTHLNAQTPTHTMHISKSIDNTPQIINKFSVCPAFR